MGDKTGIAWTDATWNPLVGCTRVSEGCRNCYAERDAIRISALGQKYHGVVKTTDAGPRWTGEVRLVEGTLDLPLRWKRPRRIFVTSMSDAHHEQVPDEWRDKILAVVALTPYHTYQWLTKRADRMRAYFSDPQTPFRVQKAIDALAVDARDGDEEWRAVIGYEGHYEVSSSGRVRSKTGRAVRPRPRGKGYRAVSLSRNGEVSDRLVQHLVLEAFIGPAGADEEARHANDDRSDNRLANLSWGTRAQNMADAARHGTAGVWMKGRSTLTPEQVAEIRHRRSTGEKLDDIAVAIGSNRKQVSAVALGKIFKPADISWPLPNLHVGVSAEDQATADARIPLLLQTPAAVRWVSYEPALGPVDFNTWLSPWRPQAAEWASVKATVSANPPRIDWLVVGGESGSGARPFDLEWALSAIAQGRAAGVPVFVKQLGAKPFEVDPDPTHGRFGCVLTGDAATDYYLARIWMGLHDRKGGDPSEWPEDLRIRQFPKGGSQ